MSWHITGHMGGRWSGSKKHFKIYFHNFFSFENPSYLGGNSIITQNNSLKTKLEVVPPPSSWNVL
jgi:hypothetical protein